MQNDHREYYSEDTLRAKSNNFKELQDIKLLTTDQQFYSGTPEEIMLNYMAANHEIKNWYTPEKLIGLLKRLRSGASFEAAYGH